ncbi:diguanylate cyclase domain-containing protein [Vibrio nitrifigilis]|uniref:diguanylate cyclase n=1 Tax=Vibrio nitrifigilis TaxID=2789781 RepID=A0ABS0GBI1_9VIBR|nr:diguanylate cyclase [Vibrio nitrifigilis]MBF8999721.1 diguanylate cyclase [Vibrio nitrifigilis]
MKRLEFLEQFRHDKRRPVLLIVDDQPINIRALNEIFKDEFDVVMATSGGQAIEQARAQQPDIILLDIVMPEMDGYEVCRLLNQDPLTLDIPIIFVTAETEDNVEAHGFEVGAVDFITKPFNPLIVRARVMTHLTLKLQMDIMRDMVLIDGLTGLANRRRFDQALKGDWNLCQREHKPLALLMVDVDYFKRYNDTYGHIAGDECLKLVGKALQSSVRRTSDICCRYGGEEFCCLLPFTDEEGATICANNILQAVRDLNIEHESSDAAKVVTVSIGQAFVVPSAAITAEQLLLYADQALYVSKQHGRNRTSIFCETETKDN